MTGVCVLRRLLQRANENNGVVFIMGTRHFPHTPFCILDFLYQSKFNTKKSSSILPLAKGGIFIAIYHCGIKIISRGKGKSAVAAAAYRSGDKIKNDYDGVLHDYSHKKGIVHSEIILPPHAPPEFAKRCVLWNSVEKIEKSKNSQLAREIEISLPKELTREAQISLVRDYVKDNFVSAGMCADFSVHDKEDGNPHAHIMLTMRPLEADGQWGAKSQKRYITDENGERIKLKNGNFKTEKVSTVDWNEQSKAELWRSKWADIANKYLAENSVDERIDHRSYQRQGIEQIPTIHLGVAASQMEKKGIPTERGNINREIKAQNKILAEIKAKLSALKNWLDGIFKASPSATLAEKSPVELIMSLSGQRQSMFNKIYVLKDVSSAVAYLQENNITTVNLLDEKIAELRGGYNTTRRQIVDIENHLKGLTELIQQTEIYKKHREMYKEYKSIPQGKDTEFQISHLSEIIAYEAAVRYLKEHLTDGKLYLEKWKAEHAELSSQKNSLYDKYHNIKDELKTCEDIHRSVKSALRQQGRPTPKRNIDMEL